MRALRSGLDDVKWLCAKGCHYPGHRAVREIDKRILLDISLGLKVLENIICAHAERRRACLLQGSSGEPSVKTKDAMFLPDDLGRMET